MGQPITVVETPSSRRGVYRYEINRSLSGMGHERYTTDTLIEGDRPVDELARRLLARDGLDTVHINSNVITVELSRGYDNAGIADVIRELFLFYRPGDPAVAADVES